MSTTEALLDLLEDIATSLENNKYTVGVFIELKRRPLILLIMIYCISNCFSMVCGVKWIQSYLEK